MKHDTEHYSKDCREEKLCFRAYHSSDALKHDIRERISRLGRLNWEFYGMRNKGSFLSLCFTRRHETDPLVETRLH